MRCVFNFAVDWIVEKLKISRFHKIMRIMFCCMIRLIHILLLIHIVSVCF